MLFDSIENEVDRSSMLDNNLETWLVCGGGGGGFYSFGHQKKEKYKNASNCNTL